MRTSLLYAAFLGLFAVGCAGELSGTGEGDDVQPPEDCGNGAVDSGETCDDGNITSGDGCSSTCQMESTGGTPRVASSLDKMTVTTQLGKSETVTLTVMSVDGFAGDVTIAASLVDGANAPITAVMLQGPTTVNVPADGTAPAQYTLQVPTTATGVDLTGSLKFNITSSAAPITASANVSIAAVYTVEYGAAIGTNINMHPGAITRNVTVVRGAKLRFTNADTIAHRTHGQGAFPHEAIDGGQPGGTYELNTTVFAPGSTGQLGCHTHPGVNNATYANFTIQ